MNAPETERARPPEAKENESSFEQALKRLGDIVERLEGGDLGLEESLKLFEEGVKLARKAQQRLDSAEKRVEELMAIDAQGNPVVRGLPADS